MYVKIFVQVRLENTVVYFGMLLIWDCYLWIFFIRIPLQLLETSMASPRAHESSFYSRALPQLLQQKANECSLAQACISNSDKRVSTLTVCPRNVERNDKDGSLPKSW